MSAERLAYINKYKQDMVDASKGTGLFPSVMMAQGILESRNGLSELSAKYNNHFGIKCQCRACPCYLLGQNVTMPTYEEVGGRRVLIQDKFRTYKNTYDSFVDRIDFLKSNPRYRNAGVFSAKTPQEQTAALLRAGYATDSNYDDSLNSLIAKYNLESLDRMKGKRRLTTNQTNYAVIGVVLIAMTAYAYYLKKKKVF